MMFKEDKLKEKCGIFGVWGPGLDTSRISFYGLFALQHRGQEASGIACSNGSYINYFKDLGLVTQVYSENDIRKLRGHIAIGHNLYSNTKISSHQHIQPIIAADLGVFKNPAKALDINFAIAHNGNIPSLAALQTFLTEAQIPHNNFNDSELMAAAIAVYREQGYSLSESVEKAFPLFTGCFSLLVMDTENLIAVRDYCGIRPLVMGSIGDSTYVFASETCAFQTTGAEFIREIEPGEILSINRDGINSKQLAKPNLKLDLFEFVYFSRPDSILHGQSVYEVRKRSGIALAKEYPLDIDMVVPIPDTATPAAVGYSQTLGIPVEWALVKNRYIHRTFIQPDQHTRDLGVKLKLNPLTHLIRGKRIALIDDSIVRGTTSKQIIRSLFDAGAKEVHFLVSSPPIKFPDFYGIDTPKQTKLIAAYKSLEEIKEYLAASSIHYLSLEALIEATNIPAHELSSSCFTGIYPIDLMERLEEVSYSV